MPTKHPVIRELDKKELQWCDDAREMARALFQRYTSAVPSAVTPEQMDVVYSAWCDDDRDDLPPLQFLYQGFGILLGDLFRERFDYEWKMITDDFGSEISLYMQSPNATLQNSWLSPLSMVGKRVRDGRPFVAALFSTIVAQHEKDGYKKRAV